MNREKHIRNALFIISLMAIVMAVSEMDFGRTNRYDDLLVDDGTFAEIKESRTEVENPQNPELYFDDNLIYFDSLSDHFLYSLIEDSPSKDNPTIRSVSHEYSNYDIAILNDVLSDESIEANDNAHMLLYDEDSYKEFTLSATTLPIVSVNMNEMTADRNNPIGHFDERAHFELFDNRKDVPSSERVTKSQTYIRLRGASSLRFPKNQFRLNLREFSIGGSESNNHLSLLDMRQDDDWILYSPYNDPEKMRNTLSNNLWYDVMGENNPFDINTGTRGEFVEVFIDGMYWGIYSLMYPIDAKGLDLDLDNSATSDFYYRTFSHEAFAPEDFTHYDSYYERGRFELRDPDSNGQPFQWDPLVQHMLSLDLSEDELLNYIEHDSYLPNLIDYYLFYILLQARDNDTKNHNYISKYMEDKHITIESPWDLDLTWGQVWTPTHPRRAEVRREPTHNFQPNISHVTRLIELGEEDVIDQVDERYTSLRSNEWSETELMARISDFEKDVYGSGAAMRDYTRWPTSAYASDTSELRNYILTRLSSMDDYMDGLLGGALNSD